MIDIEKILVADGPMLSSDLAKRLIAAGLSSDAARQRISRAAPRIGALKGLRFPKGVRFLFHKDHEGSERYWTALERDIEIASPAYAAALAALKARDGIVPLEHFAIVSGSPFRQRGQISSATVLERLEAVHLVGRTNVHGIGEAVVLRAGGHLGIPNYPRLRARIVVENILLLALRDWARRLGVASHDAIAVRGDGNALPMFGTFHWDLCGPSYLVPIMRRARDGTPKPGFLVGDVLLGNAVDEKAIAAFLRKYELSSYLPRLSAFLPVLIADGYTEEAFRRGRAMGVMLATPKNLFGRDVAVGLATLLETLSKAAAVAVGKPEVIGELFDKLGSIDGAQRNLRGALFELVVGHVVQARFGGSIDINHLIRDDGFEAELDVRRVLAGDVWIYECKGYQPDHLIGVDEIERWLTERVPGIFISTKHEARFAQSDIHFEFWTSGKFTPEAVARLEKAKAGTRRYSIGWKSGADVAKEIAKSPSSGMKAMFDEHFLKHPIAKFDKRHDGSEALASLNSHVDVPSDPAPMDFAALFATASALPGLPPPNPTGDKSRG